MTLFNYCEVVAGTTEAKTKSKIELNCVGDFHSFDQSRMISLRRIPPTVVETGRGKEFLNGKNLRKCFIRFCEVQSVNPS